MSDISDILNDWPYDPAACVRKITAEDGREVVQVRTPLGIEQYELDGRPDGSVPYGFESVLEHVETLRLEHVGQCGTADGFTIDRTTAAELRQEGLLYYYRYLVCFQIGEYEIVARDARRNLKMFDLLKAHCNDLDSVNESEQYRPYVLRMAAVAEALLAINASDHALAKDVIRKAISIIDELPEVPTPTFGYEKRRSLAILRGMMRALPRAKPPTEGELLLRELRDAVAEENYERAAVIRDRLRGLKRPATRRKQESMDERASERPA